MPDGYGVTAEGPYLDWSVVEGTLIEATEYWLSSTRPDGRPHVVPRWGVWLDGLFWYDGSPLTRHARNLARNPACALHLQSGSTVTIVEGPSHPSTPITGDLGERLSVEYARKYKDLGYEPEPGSWADEEAGGMRVLTPVTVIAWASFPTDVTRFTFA